MKFKKDDSKGEILAFRRVHTRGNPNFETLHVVEDLERILRKGKERGQEGTSKLESYFSSSEEIFLTIQDLDLDVKFEQISFKIKI